MTCTEPSSRFKGKLNEVMELQLRMCSRSEGSWSVCLRTADAALR